MEFSLFVQGGFVDVNLPWSQGWGSISDTRAGHSGRSHGDANKGVAMAPDIGCYSKKRRTTSAYTPWPKAPGWLIQLWSWVKGGMPRVARFIHSV